MTPGADLAMGTVTPINPEVGRLAALSDDALAAELETAPATRLHLLEVARRLRQGQYGRSRPTDGQRERDDRHG